MRAIVAGHICLDFTPRLPADAEIVPGTLREVGPMTVSAGGCVYNTGSALAESGIEVVMAAEVGQDVLGDLLAEQLRTEGFTAALTRSPELATSFSIVLERPGEDRSFWHHVGACADFDGSRVSLADADALHVGYPSLLPALAADGGRALLALLHRARGRGLLTSVDLAVVDETAEAASIDWTDLLARMCALTDVFTPSIDDLRSALSADATDGSDDVVAHAEWAIAHGAAVVALSAGSRGSFLAVADEERLRRVPGALAMHAAAWSGYRGWVPAAPVDVVRTTNGAGDAHSAGFLAALLRGADPGTAARCAAEAARARIQGLPIRESIPQ